MEENGEERKEKLPIGGFPSNGRALTSCSMGICSMPLFPPFSLLKMQHNHVFCHSVCYARLVR